MIQHKCHTNRHRLPRQAAGECHDLVGVATHHTDGTDVEEGADDFSVQHDIEWQIRHLAAQDDVPAGGGEEKREKGKRDASERPLPVRQQGVQTRREVCDEIMPPKQQRQQHSADEQPQGVGEEAFQNAGLGQEGHTAAIWSTASAIVLTLCRMRFA